VYKLDEVRTVAADCVGTTPAVEARSLRKRFGAIEALRDVSFSVAPREIYGLLGPNGAGKSTTINILSGLCHPDSGSAWIDGMDTQSLEARRALGLVPQELALFTELNARENLWFFGRLYGLFGSDLHSRIDRVLDMVNLRDRSREPVGKYSGGMLRRLNIAAGVLHSPKVVLMDEPTVGLDPQNRRSILEMVQQVAAAGAAVVYSTHYMDEVEQICSRVGIVDHGALLIEGTLEELRAKVGNRQVVTLRGVFSAAFAASALTELSDVELVKATAEELVFSVAAAENRLPALLNAAGRAVEIREVNVNHQTLESLFIKLTGRELRE
jgi:ABC-2 type transport system ATP-binding protein